MGVRPFYLLQEHLEQIQDKELRRDLERTAVSVAGQLGCAPEVLRLARWNEAWPTSKMRLEQLLRQDVRGLVPFVRSHPFVWEWNGIWCTSDVAAQVFLDACVAT